MLNESDVIEIGKAVDTIVAIIGNTNELDRLANELVERKYQLRVEHNHGDMQWYAYYARKGATVNLFDEDEHRGTMASTPTEALRNLKESAYYLKESL